MGALTTVSAVVLVWAIIDGNIGTQTNAASGNDLYDASYFGQLAKARQLLGDECKDVNKRRTGLGNNVTPLHIAVQEKHLQVVMLLLSCNANPDIEATNGVTPLMAAIRYNANVEYTYAILSAHPALDVQDDNGWFALQVASRYDKLDASKALLAAGASINMQDTVNGHTALMYAAYYAHLNLINTLLNYGADMNIQNNDGETALHWAAKANGTANIKTLLQHGADTMIKSKTGKTAKDIAREYGKMDILQLIEEYTETTTFATATIAATTTTDDPCVMNCPTQGNDNTTTISKHTLTMLVISLGCVVFVLVIAMIGGCVYYKCKPPVQCSREHAVIFTNVGDRDSNHIYEN